MISFSVLLALATTADLAFGGIQPSLVSSLSAPQAGGIENFIEQVQGLSQLAFAATGIFFFVGIVVNFAQAHLSSSTGDTIGYAHALQQGILSVVLMSIAAAGNEIAASVSQYLNADNLTTYGGVIIFWSALARLVVGGVLGGVGIWMTVSVVYAGVGAQVGNIIGSPAVMSNAVIKVATLIGGGLLTFSTVWISNYILDLIIH